MKKSKFSEEQIAYALGQAESGTAVAAALAVRGVIDLAGPADLTANIDGYERPCRDSVITKPLGRTTSTVPERFAAASPRAR